MRNFDSYKPEVKLLAEVANNLLNFELNIDFKQAANTLLKLVRYISEVDTHLEKELDNALEEVRTLY